MSLISGIASVLAIGLLSPVQSILALICLFLSIAISLYINGYVLMGILYILVYVGAIAILFLFILSLLNIEYTPVGGMNPLIIFLILIMFLPFDISFESYSPIESINTVTNELDIVGTLFYSEYALILLLLGIILVLSVIGAIAITR
jgi:NADH:ubiquinone oxidoreductase subunit 6 (subunit J)|uniref:NADH-ubiquinone oxidoreductase chain 6 n=1 Tax=Candida viswanathii TaxID=5486 RepID=D2CJZ5_9ASCO|nr:Nad6p [Candida viswanathii]ABP03912.1 Nad6p [Candida viswanathii]